MVAFACFAKAVVVTIAALVLAAGVSLPLRAAGMPLALLQLLWAVGMGALAAYVAKEDLESRRTWLWTVGGFVLGLLIVPGLAFAHEWDQAKQRERFLVGCPHQSGDRAVA